MMLLPAAIVFSSLLSSAFAGGHGRLKFPKKFAPKPALIEVLSNAHNQTGGPFNPTLAAPKSNIFNSLTNDEAVRLRYD
jgi:hypothetical protein